MATRIATKMEKSNYRKCAAIFLIKSRCATAAAIANGESSYMANVSDIEVFAGERSDIPGAWQVPQGGVEENETHLCAAVRELKEETGVTSIKLLKNTRNLYRYDFPEQVVEKIKHSFHEGFVGQEIRFFLFEFFGDDAEISVSNCKCQEFARWQWMKMDNLMSGIVDFKKKAYMAAGVELGIYCAENSDG
jgi:8-oxo-dGTP pyrophosphatase MutT (NUDIX family)